MRDLLHLIFEYRRLLARAETAACLRPASQRRLVALEKLFGKEPNTVDESASANRRHARCEIQAPATIRLEGRVQPVNVVNLGGGGVCVSPAPNVPQGTTALLRILSEDKTRVYQYQVRASWSTRSNGESHMGMPFVGIPREVPIEDDRAQLLLLAPRVDGEDAELAR